MQRSAAARMFVREGELLVIDDVSSALDVETERELWRRIAELEGTTSLVVSHRRAAYRAADRIVVLEDAAWRPRASSTTCLLPLPGDAAPLGGRCRRYGVLPDRRPIVSRELWAASTLEARDMIPPSLLYGPKNAAMRCGPAVIVTLLSFLLTAGCASSETADEPSKPASTPVPDVAAADASPSSPEEPDIEPVENMEQARTVPAAVMLQDGKLLIVGGGEWPRDLLLCRGVRPRHRELGLRGPDGPAQGLLPYRDPARRRHRARRRGCQGPDLCRAGHR